ncbi:MAG: endo-1,4-beta-xylanase [Bacteroidales bacterium]|nr:endo-1,4-beta-xylanase [Bacteroidales bacterium]
MTELDLTCFDNYHGSGAAERQKIKNSVHYTDELADAQAAQYAMIFDVLHQNRDKISSVTFWCLTDRTSWLNNFPIRGRLDYPLLFDSQHQPKKAFFAVKDVFTK